MNDPLPDFDWTTLYERYDAGCNRYKSSSRCLDRFGADRPTSDRSLYYRLIECYAPSARTTDPDMIGTYKALLYWKLYSTQGNTGTNIIDWLAPGSEGRHSAQLQLPKLLCNLPPSLGRDAQHMTNLVQELPQIHGMGSSTRCSLPVRTTFLHFLYPSTVPIFDQNVLKAVSRWDKGAIQDFAKLEEYLTFAWRLADHYSVPSSIGTKDGPLGRIEMALWVNRGERKGEWGRRERVYSR